MMYAAMGMSGNAMDEMLGKDFEKGLARMKTIAELEVPATRHRYWKPRNPLKNNNRHSRLTFESSQT